MAWDRPGISVDLTSERRSALSYYSGRLYEPRFKERLLSAIDLGCHCLIISGGYGVLRAEEYIHDYEAHLPRTATVWRSRIPLILGDYVKLQGIRRSLGAFSSGYGRVVPKGLTEDDVHVVPQVVGTGAVLNELREAWDSLLSGL